MDTVEVEEKEEDPEEEERQVIRRIDWRLIPVMLAVNSLQLIDKNVSVMIRQPFSV